MRCRGGAREGREGGRVEEEEEKTKRRLLLIVLKCYVGTRLRKKRLHFPASLVPECLRVAILMMKHHH